LLFIASWTNTNAECSKKRRVRKAWHSLSDEDQMLFVNGFQELHRNSRLIQFIESHQKATGSDEYNIHKSAQNLYWHSYWLYELENAFRDLGEEYECFTLPYWDVTRDGKYWLETENPDINDIPIYNGNLGGEGDIDNDYCVGGLWSKEHYFTEKLCSDSETDGKCCLKRWHADLDDLDRATVLYGPETIAEYVYTNPKAQNFNNFVGGLSGYHGDVHSFFGSAAGTHFCGDGGGAPTYEPLFPVFHTFIEYLRLLHQDCNQFDLVSVDRLEDLGTDAYDETYKGGDTPLDYVMDFSILCDETGGKKKAMCSEMDITPRLMWDVSPNSDFGIVYELGDFWTDNEELKTQCADNLNATWWKVPAADKERHEVVEEDEEFVSEHVVRSTSSKGLTSTMSLSVMVLMVMAVAVMAVLRTCISRKKGLKETAIGMDHIAYGTV